MIEPKAQAGPQRGPAPRRKPPAETTAFKSWPGPFEGASKKSPTNYWIATSRPREAGPAPHACLGRLEGQDGVSVQHPAARTRQGASKKHRAGPPLVDRTRKKGRRGLESSKAGGSSPRRRKVKIVSIWKQIVQVTTAKLRWRR